jgi:exodeoxyribonuclease VII large subunit
MENELRTSFDRILTEKRNRLALVAGRLDGLSPMKKLSQGYSVTLTTSGQRVNSVNAVEAGEAVEIYVEDGRIDATVTGVRKEDR